jgi:hypothetical protein
LNNDDFSLSNFEIYPNPVDNLLNFKANELIKEVKIHDVSGRKVFELKSENITKVDITNLSKGIYTITISNESHKTSKKIVKN